jgi:hypothetical protein
MFVTVCLAALAVASCDRAHEGALLIQHPAGVAPLEFAEEPPGTYHLQSDPQAVYPLAELVARREGAAHVRCVTAPGPGWRDSSGEATQYDILNGCVVTALKGDAVFADKALEMARHTVLPAPPGVAGQVWEHDFVFTLPAWQDVSWGPLLTRDGSAPPDRPRVILPAFKAAGERPTYPMAMMELERTGQATARCDVGVDGFPVNCTVETMTEQAFGASVLRAAMLSRFRPALVNGQPVAESGAKVLASFMFDRGAGPGTAQAAGGARTPEDADFSIDGVDLSAHGPTVRLDCQLDARGEATMCAGPQSNGDPALTKRAIMAAMNLRYPWVKVGGAILPQTQVSVIVDFGVGVDDRGSVDRAGRVGK